jgi:hypothetical protein
LRQFPGGGHKKTFAEYMNVPAIIATLISKRMATLHELSTIYGVRDAYDMLEIATVDDYNLALARQEK